MPPECDRPPEGWYCTRGLGHEGPCAARPERPMLADMLEDVGRAWINDPDNAADIMVDNDIGRLMMEASWLLRDQATIMAAEKEHPCLQGCCFQESMEAWQKRAHDADKALEEQRATKDLLARTLDRLAAQMVDLEEQAERDGVVIAAGVRRIDRLEGVIKEVLSDPDVPGFAKAHLQGGLGA